jgi:hypothetical protein
VRSTIRVSASLLLALCLGFAAACDENVTVTGVVRSQTAAPVPGVSVTLETSGRAPDKATTGEDGSFNVGIVGADPRRTRIHFEKTGFIPQERNLGREARSTMNIVLLRAAPESDHTQGHLNP